MRAFRSPSRSFGHNRIFELKTCGFLFILLLLFSVPENGRLFPAESDQEQDDPRGTDEQAGDPFRRPRANPAADHHCHDQQDPEGTEGDQDEIQDVPLRGDDEDLRLMVLLFFDPDPTAAVTAAERRGQSSMAFS